MGHSKKICTVDSEFKLQKQQMETMVQPLSHKFSSVGSLLCKNLQVTKALVGGTYEFQRSLLQGTRGP